MTPAERRDIFRGVMSIVLALVWIVSGLWTSGAALNWRGTVDEFSQQHAVLFAHLISLSLASGVFGFLALFRFLAALMEEEE